MILISLGSWTRSRVSTNVDATQGHSTDEFWGHYGRKVVTGLARAVIILGSNSGAKTVQYQTRTSRIGNNRIKKRQSRNNSGCAVLRPFQEVQTEVILMKWMHGRLRKGRVTDRL